ncbi:hypothetical protein [Alicyclobacillus acidiphilus]|uniref:hypothetical protein n=1 Tax=Alicyclobacillus acidiphilus TaxID=182455 RepID=UPI00289369E1|nr:hypothetical protein [Alicyclobacillus acidiphilus]
MADNMAHYALVLEASRKSKAIRHVYEVLRARNKSPLAEPSIQFGDIVGIDGIRVDPQERYRILNLRIHDEHLSPYFHTNMNLFQMLMIDEETEMNLYRGDRGWLLAFAGLSSGPQPFGQNGFDLR